MEKRDAPTQLSHDVLSMKKYAIEGTIGGTPLILMAKKKRKKVPHCIHQACINGCRARMETCVQCIWDNLEELAENCVNYGAQKVHTVFEQTHK